MSNQSLLDPIALLTHQLADKNLKKSAIQQMGTIALALGPVRTRKQMLPLLLKTFADENQEIRLCILKSMGQVLEHLRPPQGHLNLLSFLIDVLCVFGEEDLRKQAFSLLQKVAGSFDLGPHGQVVVGAIIQLSKQTDKHIKEVVLRLIWLIYSLADGDTRKLLTVKVKVYLQREEQTLLLTQILPRFVEMIPIFPEEEINYLINSLLQNNSAKVRASMVPSIIARTKTPGQEVTSRDLNTLIEDPEPQVTVSLIKHINELKILFNEDTLRPLLTLFDRFQSIDNSVRNALLQNIENIPLPSDKREAVFELSGKFLSLNKTLSGTLCRLHDIESLTKLTAECDAEFRNKLFPKLPPTCELHVKLLDDILASKNWRNKITILQNVEKRLDEGEKVEILVPVLLRSIGDRIGICRTTIISLLARILALKKIGLTQIVGDLEKSLASKNWFERQAVFMLLLSLSETGAQMNLWVVKDLLRVGKKDQVENVTMLVNKLQKTYNLIL